jgi:pSer/pThr/pTyr-binding forkhead associated (FHA) protein
MYKLIIQDDEGKTTVVPLIRDEISIGRKEGNTIRLTERNVSRKHARLVKSNGSVLLEDLESYNGIRVNGARIQGRVTVAETDRIQIGDYLLELKVDRATAGPNEATAEHVPVEPAPKNGESAATARTMTGNAPPPSTPLAAATPTATLPDEPTIRVSTAAATQASPAASAAPQVNARLVCLSSNFAGREYKLDKPAMVIGRTDDNDIVVNHRSISRHHAKIVKDGSRYSIVDLQSSNGVRVNGEEYGKVDLRKGDLVDLGHVRLRFVEAGEDFVFHRDATVVDLSLEGGKKSRLPLAIALVVLAAGGVALWLVLRHKGEAEQGIGPGNGSLASNTPPPADAAPPPPPADAASAGQSGAINEEVAQKLAAAQKAITSQDWSAALSAADAAFKKDPQNAEAKRLVEQARREAEAQTAFEALTKALAQPTRDVDAASEAYSQIPEDSVYRDKARAKLEPALGKWFDVQRAAAARQAEAGKCDKLGPLKDKVGQLLPERVAEIEKLETRCTAQHERESRPPRTPVETRPAPPTGDPDALLEESKQAWNGGHWEEARAKADKVLQLRPGDQSALTYATLASCKLGRADMAKRYASKLGEQRRKTAEAACATAGVALP